MKRFLFTFIALFAFSATSHLTSQTDLTKQTQTQPLKLLYLGDPTGHHATKARYDQIAPVLAKKHIELTYTNDPNDLLTKLDNFDALMVYANIDTITPEQEKALLKYVESGKGFFPLHCASACFKNSDAIIKLIGGQFRSHTVGVFRTKSVNSRHPIMQGFQSFQSWDETYVHTKHNDQDRTVLEVREDIDLKEPWTWVRNHGQGRVFYTAWGHDHRTWSHPGFQNLIERGIRWICKQEPTLAGEYIDKPKMTEIAKEVKPFEFQPATLPFYPPGEKWGTLREPIKQMQKPLTADESIKHYSTPEDFELKTFVDETKLGGGKPICMTWDEQGRLWLALTFDYPNELQKIGEGRDKIVCCEDTDGDGVCDKVVDFADKLSIPTSMLPVRGGLLVHMAPTTYFFKDTDNDGKADLKKELFTGWNTRDTHAGPSNLRYGPDNWIYGMCGYSGFDGVVNGEKVKFGQGLYRFKLELQQQQQNKNELTATKLEFLRSTNNNSWGVAFNEQGELFGSTANGCPLVHMNIPNRYYEKVKGLTPGPLQNIAYDNHVEPIVKDFRQVDWHGGFTAGAGCAIYTARTYPPEYWNKVAFVCEPTAHICAGLVLQPNGASYTARYGWNLMASNDDWAAPIDAQVGPDGHMWVIDWYNIIVQHNPTPQGYKTGKGNAYEIDLRDKKYGRVYRVVYKKAKPEERVTLKAASEEKLKQISTHHNMTWRLHAQRLIEESKSANAQEQTKIVLEQLRGSNMNQRLQALLNVADAAKSAEFAAEIAKMLTRQENLNDPSINHALIIAAVAQGQDSIVEILKQKSMPKEAGKPIELIAQNITYTDVNPVFTSLQNSESDLVRQSLLRGMVLAKKPDAKLSADAVKSVGVMLEKLPAEGRGQLLKLANAWGVQGLDEKLKEFATQLLTKVSDAKVSESERIAAAKNAVEYSPKDEAVANALLAQIKANNANSTLQQGLLEALSVSQVKSVGQTVISIAKELPANVRTNAMRLGLATVEGAKAFLAAVEKGELRFDMLALDQKTALATHPDKAVAVKAKELLAKGGGLPDADRQKVIVQLEHVIKKTGDPTAGKAAFVQHCAKCHKHGDQGQTIGPDLTGFAVHPKEEILIHVLDPSRSVEGNYKQYQAALADGRVLLGILASETKTAIELVDAEGKRNQLQRSDIEEFKETQKSLMPEGFEKQMKEEELVNLLEFLTQKGKYIPIPLDKYSTVVSTKSMFYDPNATVERLTFADWKPKEFNGIPFYLVDPDGDKKKNVILLQSDQGPLVKDLPKNAILPCNTAAKSIHILGGVAGWAIPFGEKGTISLVVNLQYADGKTEKHELKNGIHIADYIRRVDVPESKFAFLLQGNQQLRYLAITPKRNLPIASIEFAKGGDSTAPLIFAVTIETP